MVLETLVMVLLLDCDMFSTGSCVWALGPQLVALFWKLWNLEKVECTAGSRNLESGDRSWELEPGPLPVSLSPWEWKRWAQPHLSLVLRPLVAPLAPVLALCLLWWTVSPFTMWKQASPLSCSERYFVRVTRRVTKLPLFWESRLRIMMMSPHVCTYHKFKVLPSVFNKDVIHPNVNNILHFKCSCYCEPRFWNINHDLLL